MALIEIDPALLAALDRPAPRYTSYPTAPSWKEMTEGCYRDALRIFDQEDQPLSIYVHIPFCRSMCLYCGCSVILNRNEDRQDVYVDAVLAEAKLYSFQRRHEIKQLHLGGGTPTQLTEKQLTRLIEGLYAIFTIAPDAEISIEVDPRNGTDKLVLLKSLGFNRVSFGVQDTNADVQKAVRRHQSYEMTRDTMYKARELGFSSVNIDLIYGLPLQTEVSFQETIGKIIELSPDRLALFSYAKVPWLKPHQKAIADKDLPLTPVKFAIYAYARKALIEAGYVAIGMDHFAKKDDEIAKAFAEKRLQRNFQGYSLKLAENMIGLGVTSIGSVSHTYIQNAKELETYYSRIQEGKLPVQKGCVLTDDDKMRRYIINTLMCDFEIDKRRFQDLWKCNFDDLVHFSSDLVENSASHFRATALGALFIRNIAMNFDNQSQNGRYSQAI